MAQPTVQDRAKAQENLISKQVQGLRNQGWGDFKTEAKTTNSTPTQVPEFDSSQLYFTPTEQPKTAEIKQPLTDGYKNPFLNGTPQIEYAPRVEDLQKIVEVEKKEIAAEQARILDLLQLTTEFDINGSVDFGRFHEIQTPIPEPETTLGLEPALPAEHQAEVEVDLRQAQENQPTGSFDLKYFGKEVGNLAYKEAYDFGSWVIKKTLNAKNFIDAKLALSDLFFSKILGFGEKKPLTPEEQQQKNQQAANKRTFFAALRSGVKSLINPEQKRALKSRIESINKSLNRGNLSYEGIIDEQTGQVRENVLMDSQKAEAQKTEEQKKAEERKKMVATITAKKKGPGITTTMDKSHNFNNAAKLAG